MEKIKDETDLYVPPGSNYYVDASTNKIAYGCLRTEFIISNSGYKYMRERIKPIPKSYSLAKAMKAFNRRIRKSEYKKNFYYRHNGLLLLIYASKYIANNPNKI